MIIVTGGAGFIGSNLVAGLNDRGIHDIVVCDWLGNDDKWRNLAKRELRDLIPPERLFDYLDKYASKVEMIYHLGAVSSTTETDCDLVVQTNFTLSRNLWKWCALHGKRFIYASSAATYGDGSEGFVDDDSIEGLSRLQPLNPYGWSKHIFDRRTVRVVAEHGQRADDDPLPPQWAGLKFFNVYGPNEYHKGGQKSVIAHLHPQVAAGATAKLFKSYHPDYPDGGQKRDFVWVGDCVDVMLWLYDHPTIKGIYNVGTGEARTFDDLARATYAAAGEEPKIQYIDMPETLKDKYQYFTQASMEKLRKAGYDKPFTPLEDGVRQYVQDFMSRGDPYR